MAVQQQKKPRHLVNSGVKHETSAGMAFSSDLLTPEEERELLATFWECKNELVRTHDPPFPEAAGPPPRPRTLAHGAVHSRLLRCRTRATKPELRRTHDRYIHCKHRLASANIRLAAHVAKRFRHHALGYSDLLARSRLRPDAGDRPLRRQPRHPPGDVCDVVDSPDAADRGRSAEPSGQPVAAPLARTRPASTRIRSSRPRRPASAQPARAGQPHRQQPRTPDPPANRHPRSGVA